MVAMPPINIVASNVYGPKASDVVAKGIIKKYHISGDVIKQNNIKPTTNSLDVFSLILFVILASLRSKRRKTPLVKSGCSIKCIFPAKRHPARSVLTVTEPVM